MTETEVVIDYSPRPLQWALHEALTAKRFAVAVCHRRFGKTVCAINQLIKGALTLERESPRFAYMAPYLKQAKGVSWDFLKKYSRDIPGHQINESELRIDYPNGGRVRLYGADNADALRGIYLDGVVLDEYGDMDGEAWSSIIRPALSDRQGWALFIGTPNGKNQFFTLIHGDKEAGWVGAKNHPEWHFAEYRASQTGIISPQELQANREIQSPDEYDREFECSFETSVKGAVYAEEMRAARSQDRITLVPYDPAIKVDTDWDLGVDDSTAIWFTQVTYSGAIRVIDYYENNGKGLDHYANVIRSKPYAYGEHYAPHDLSQRELGTGVTLQQTAYSLGLNFQIVPRQQNAVMERVWATRHVLPVCYFDEKRCERGVETLKHYRWAEVGDNATGIQKPVHDWASHGADAFGQFALRFKARKPRVVNTRPQKDYDPDDRRPWHQPGRFTPRAGA